MYVKKGNLLASCGNAKDIKIFDKRESKIIKTFDGVHSGDNLDLLKKRLNVCLFSRGYYMCEMESERRYARECFE